MIYGFIHINNFNNSIRDIEVLQDMNYNVHNLLSRTRMLTGVLTQSGEDIINDRLPVLLSYIDNIENKYIPILKKYSLTPASEKPVVVYNTDGQRSEYVHYNGYELVKNIVVWGRGIFNVPAKEFIARTERGENILEDYRIKYIYSINKLSFYIYIYLYIYFKNLPVNFNNHSGIFSFKFSTK